MGINKIALPKRCLKKRKRLCLRKRPKTRKRIKIKIIKRKINPPKPKIIKEHSEPSDNFDYYENQSENENKQKNFYDVVVEKDQSDEKGDSTKKTQAEIKSENETKETSEKTDTNSNSNKGKAPNEFIKYTTSSQNKSKKLMKISKKLNYHWIMRLQKLMKKKMN